MNITELNLNDTSCYISEWENILESYGEYVSSAELWEEARQYEELPHFGNLYQKMVMQRLVDCLRKEFNIKSDSEALNYQIDANAICGSFVINGTKIQSAEDWTNVRYGFLVKQLVDSVPYSMIFEQWECRVLSALAAYAEDLSDVEKAAFVAEANNQGFNLEEYYSNQTKRKAAAYTAEAASCLYDTSDKGEIPF